MFGPFYSTFSIASLPSATSCLTPLFCSAGSSTLHGGIFVCLSIVVPHSISLIDHDTSHYRPHSHCPAWTTSRSIRPTSTTTITRAARTHGSRLRKISKISCSSFASTTTLSTGECHFLSPILQQPRLTCCANRDQLKENALLKKYYCDVDIGDLIKYNEELAHRLVTEPAEIIPLVGWSSLQRSHPWPLTVMSPFSLRAPSSAAPIALSSPTSKRYLCPNTSCCFTRAPKKSLFAIWIRSPSRAWFVFLALSLALPLCRPRPQSWLSAVAAAASIYQSAYRVASQA